MRRRRGHGHSTPTPSAAPASTKASSGKGSAVALDAAGNVYVTGQFVETIDFSPGSGGSGTLTSAGSTDLFLVSYTAAGDFRFVYTLGETGFDAEMDVGLDAAANLYLTGQFFDTVAFDPDDTDGDGDTGERTAAGNGSAFLASYTAAGVFRFVSVPTGGSSAGRDLTTDASGVSFVTGSFGGTVDFDPGPGTTSFSAGAGTDVFVASYDAAGVYRGGFAFGGNGLNTGNGIAVDAAENSVLTGGFSNTTDFDPGPDTFSRTSAGQNDLFMARYLTGGVLPVELASFEAVADGGEVLLRWETASEANNAGFDVQRRAGDRAWQSLAFIEGHGSTTEPHTYRHRVAGLEPGTHRFRLKQVDFDGTFAYSPEVEVAVGIPGAFSLTRPYPNPFGARAQFALSVQQAQHVRIAVYDVLGRRAALLHDGALTAGTVHLFTFDGAGRAAGLYLLRVDGEQFQETLRVVLVR